MLESTLDTRPVIERLPSVRIIVTLIFLNFIVLTSSSSLAAVREKITVEGGRPELEQIRIRLIDREQFGRALIELKKIADKSHDDAEVYFYEGLVYHRLAYASKKYEDGANRIAYFQRARKCYEKARVLGFHTAQFYYHLAEVCLNLGQNEKALADLNTSIALDPKRGSWIWSTRAMAYLKLGDLEKAQADMNQALKMDSKSAHNWVKLSSLQIKAARYRDALRSINMAIYAAPNNPDLYYMRSLIENKLNYTETAQKDLDIVLSLDPQHAGALRLRGLIGAKSGELEQATVDIYEAQAIDLALDAKNKQLKPIAWTIARRLLQAQEEESTRRLASKSMNDAMTYDRALALWGLGKWKESTNALAPLLMKMTRTPSRVQLFGTCLSYLAYKNMGQIKAAEALLERIRPPVDDHRLAAAVVRYLGGQTLPIQLLKTAVTPEDLTTVRFFIGANLMASGNRSEAARHQDWVVLHGSRNCDEYLLAVMEKHRIENATRGAAK